MRILERNVYVGPSLYARFPVIKVLLDLGALEQWPTAKLGPSFIDGLVAALPTLAEHGCSYRAPGGLIRRMREDEGTWLGHVFEHVAIELQNIAGEDVSFGKTRGSETPGVYTVVYEYAQRDEGIAAGELAIELLCSLLPANLRPPGIPADGWEWLAKRDDYIRYAQRRALGPSTASLVKAAEEREIPWLRLNDQSLIQLGHGRFQQRIQATVTGRTSHLAVELAQDKEETNKILANCGLPVPRQELVRSGDAAVRAAERLGYPVVTKPYDGNHGRGISIGLGSAAEVRAGFEAAAAHSRSVIVETYLHGDDHRLLVINGELIAATRRTPGRVIGDGTHSVRDLVERVNQDPRRGVGHEKVMTRIELDAQADMMLARQNLGVDSVPTAGQIVLLRSTANLSTGGTATDVTDIIHPDNRDMAVRAVTAIGLDVGGVDFLCPDIAESYKTVGGGICEVNAAPGFRMHVAPSEGAPRDAAGPVIDMLFPPGTPARVPIACITGTNGKTTTSRMLAHIAKMAGFTPGLTTTDGVYIDGQRTVEGDMTGPVATRMVLADPSIDIAVLEVARGGLLRAGMGVPFTNVSAVLNVQSDHLGLKGIDTLEQLAEVKRIVVEVARDCAVLNADDGQAIRMSAHTEAKHLCYVTVNPQHAVVREHVRAGGRACALEAGVNGQMITLYDKGRHIPLMWTHLIPATLEGRAMHNVQNAMFAAALAFSLDIKLDAIRQGLRTFDSTFYQAPGRMNVYDEHPFKVIFDYAHNAHAVAAMTDLAGRLDVRGRRIVVVAGPGDRRDEDIRAIATAVAGHFDHYICRRDDGLRGRASDEVPRMLAAVLREHGVPESAIQLIPDEQEAVAAALAMGGEGDLVLIFADALTRSWKQVIKFKPTAAAARLAARVEADVRPGSAPPPGSAAVPANGRAAGQGAAGGRGSGPGNGAAGRDADATSFDATGFVRDERGLRFVGESAD
jgi:cyanophycin synthetase